MKPQAYYTVQNIYKNLFYKQIAGFDKVPSNDMQLIYHRSQWESKRVSILFTPTVLSQKINNISIFKTTLTSESQNMATGS